MADIDIRDVEHRFNLWGGFRDEMVATAMTLSLVVVGSFVVMERLIDRPEKVMPKIEPTQSPQTLGVTEAAPTPLAATPVASSGAEPVNLAEVVYGEDGDYDFEAYTISFTNPRLQFDSKTNLKRKLVVSVNIKNKNPNEGLPIKIVASIVKDGIVIVPEAALYLPGSRVVGPAEEVTFEASLPLVEATDVRELKFKPGNNLTEASHFLYP